MAPTRAVGFVEYVRGLADQYERVDLRSAPLRKPAETMRIERLAIGVFEERFGPRDPRVTELKRMCVVEDRNNGLPGLWGYPGRDAVLALLRATADRIEREEARAAGQAPTSVSPEPAATPTTDKPDESIRYRFIRRVGEGGFAEVWEAKEEPELNRTVAVKLFKPGASDISSALQHARALARAPHPNVVSIYAVCRVAHPESGEGRDAIVMEFLPGATVVDLIARADLDAEVVDAVCSGVLAGLRALHRAGLAHADLHAANIKLAEDGTPKLLDVMYRGTLALMPTGHRDDALAQDVRDLIPLVTALLARSGRSAAAAAFTAISADATTVEDARAAFFAAVRIRETRSRTPAVRDAHEELFGHCVAVNEAFIAWTSIFKRVPFPLGADETSAIEDFNRAQRNDAGRAAEALRAYLNARRIYFQPGLNKLVEKYLGAVHNAWIDLTAYDDFAPGRLSAEHVEKKLQWEEQARRTLVGEVRPTLAEIEEAIRVVVTAA